MIKYIYEYRELYNNKVIKEIEYTSHEVGLEEIIEDFEHFLRAIGFHFKGHLDITEE